MNKSLALLTASLLLAGCQSLAPTPDGTPPVEDANTSQAAPEPKQYASFSEETLYALLAAELAGQRLQAGKADHGVSPSSSLSGASPPVV